MTTASHPIFSFRGILALFTMVTMPGVAAHALEPSIEEAGSWSTIRDRHPALTLLS